MSNTELKDIKEQFKTKLSTIEQLYYGYHVSNTELNSIIPILETLLVQAKQRVGK